MDDWVTGWATSCVCALVVLPLRADYGNKTIMGFGIWREDTVAVSWATMLLVSEGIYASVRFQGDGTSCVCVCVCRFPLRFHSILLHSPLVVIFKMPPVFKCFCFPSWFCHFLSFTLHLRWVITLSISSHHVASLAFILHLRPPKTLFHLPPSPHCIFSFSSSSLWLYYSLQLASVHCRISDVDFSE